MSDHGAIEGEGVLEMRSKQLRLVSPELANRLGIAAEAPVLCSPYTGESDWCYGCKVVWRPLVYQVGETTRAHHFCAQGGIYVHNGNKGCAVSPSLMGRHIAASVVVDRREQIAVYQFRAVTVQEIYPPYCIRCFSAITTGVLVSASDLLSTWCRPCFGDRTDTEWAFRVDNGELRFSRPALVYAEVS